MIMPPAFQLSAPAIAIGVIENIVVLSLSISMEIAISCDNRRNAQNTIAQSDEMEVCRP